MAITASRLTCADCTTERAAHVMTLFGGKAYCPACRDAALDRAGASGPDAVRVHLDVRDLVAHWAEGAMAAGATEAVEVLVAKGVERLAADPELAGRIAAGAGALVRQEVMATLRIELGALAEARARALIAQLVAAGTAHLGADRQAVRQLAEDVLPTLVREALEGALRPKDGRMSDALEARAAAFVSRFGRWAAHTEQVGSRKIALLDMTRGQLLEAARCRSARATEEGRYATLLTSLAAGLADGQRVRDRFSAEQIEQLHQETEPLAKAV